MPQSPITLGRHIIEEEHRHHPTSGELSRLLLQVAFVAKILPREIGRAALVGQLGLVGEKNPTGDSQKKLDVFANNTAVEAFAETGLVAGLISEELEEVKQIATGSQAKYWLFTDPLDGSSNTTGYKPILEIEPESIHQKSQLAIGSTEDVLLYEKFVAGAARAAS